MVRWKPATRRVLFACFALYLVVSVTFGFVALTEDPNKGGIVYSVARSNSDLNASERAERVDAALAAYDEAHNLDEPVHERYIKYLVGVTTLDWGRSLESNERVTTILARTVPTTLAYVVPAMLFAFVGGVGLGLYTALNPGSLVDRAVTALGSVTYGVPNFWLAEIALLYSAPSLLGGLVDARTATTVVLPAAVLGTGLLAGQLRYTRAESREYVGRQFVKLVRAKGASKARIARHVLKNAAPPILSLFVADLLGVLVVNVFILERVLGIPGIGTRGLIAIEQRDLPVIIGVAFVIAFVGVLGNLLQDLVQMHLDPRTAE